jgi:TolB-like protein
VLSFNFSYAQAPKRIALLPFKINAAEDLSFLRDGIFDMLSTRLAKEGQVEVIARGKVDAAMQAVAASGKVNEAAARSIGSRLNADFTLFGSLTVLGNNVSIDAKMVDISGNKPTMTFFDQSQDLGAVITKINLIAADINDKIFGRTPVATQASAAVAAAPQPAQKKAIYAHPESVLKGDGFINQGKDAEDSAIMMSRESRQSSQKFWKSANFKHVINGVSLGDVDGDGKIETVTVTPDTVIIYRSKAGRFHKVAEISAGGSLNLTGVDVADINENGTAEIFVTTLNAKKNVLASFVLEFDGQNFVRLVDGSPWFFRVTDTPARGKILLGQRPRVSKPYSGKIYEMRWQNSGYVPTDEIKTPRQTNLLGFTIGDVLNDGQETAVAYKPDDRLRIIDAAGKVTWEGSNRWGGSMLHFSAPPEDRGDADIRIYLPLRLLIRQSAGSLGSAVITAKNYELSGHKLGFRKYTKSEIVALTWDGIGLVPGWKTRQISGFIQDLAVGDFDNDGQTELVAAVVLKEGKVMLSGGSKSTIIAYELGGGE